LERTDGNDNSANCVSNPGFLVRKIARFHSQIQLAADGIPELIDDPAPSKRACWEALLMPTDRMNASSPRIRLSVIGPPISASANTGIALHAFLKHYEPEMWCAMTKTATLTRRFPRAGFGSQATYEWTIIFLPPDADKSRNLFE
jgi:hypothetical protein